MGRLEPDGARFIATIEPWHGNEVVVYTPGESESALWTRTVIDSSLNDGHALAVADFDRGGGDEIVAGFRGAPHSLHAYWRGGSGDGWRRAVLDEGGMAAAGVFITDLNADGLPDIVAIGAATNNVAWYENLAKP